MNFNLKVKKVRRAAEDAVTLRFANTIGMSYLPGQHVRVSVKWKGETLTRTYSFSSSPYIDKDLAITVRKWPEGKMSTYLNGYAKEGMELDLEGLLGAFIMNAVPVRDRHLIMFAGGSGITPLYSMLRSVLVQEPFSIVSLIYANRSFEKIIFYPELQRLQKQFPGRLKVFHILLNNNSVPEKEKSQIYFKGELNRLVVKNLIKSLLAEIMQPSEYYLCGPYGFMKMIEIALASLNIPNDRIHKEHFFIPEQPQEADIDFTSLPERKIMINWEGLNHIVTIPTGKSILQAALDLDLKLPYSCKEAQCGTCRSFVISGEVKIKRNHILSTEEQENGQVLLCHSYAVTDDVMVQPIYKLK